MRSSMDPGRKTDMLSAAAASFQQFQYFFSCSAKGKIMRVHVHTHVHVHACHVTQEYSVCPATPLPTLSCFF